MLSFTEAPTLTAPQTMEAALASMLEAALAPKPKPMVAARLEPANCGTNCEPHGGNHMRANSVTDG